MALMGISGKPCPKCNSTNTVENTRNASEQFPLEPYPREVILKCLKCGSATSYGVWDEYYAKRFDR